MHPYQITYPYHAVRSQYDSPVIRLYCIIRMHILRQRMLSEIGQYIPAAGNVAEFGCGFGLFSLCFAMTRPAAQFSGCDLSDRRVELASKAVTRLGLANCRFECRDARDFVDNLPRLQCAYMFDLLHHMPRADVPAFVHAVWDRIEPGGTMIVKDVDTQPFHQMAFTYALDVLMTGGERPDYWKLDDFLALFGQLNGNISVHVLNDYLPFPHRLFVITKPV